MDDLLFSLNTVFPLLVMMAVGFAARCCRLLDDAAVRRVNACVFRIFLPLLLCFSLADTRPHANVDWKTLLFALCSTVACFGLMFALAPRLAPQRRDRGVLIQGVARSNYAIFGIPLVTLMYPHADTSIAALMVAVVVPVFNVMSTVALMMYSDQKVGVASLLRGIALNPLILGTAAGVILWQCGLALPALVDAPLRQLAGIATPLELFLLGASLDFTKARQNRRLITISVVGRLVAVPLLFLPLGVALGARDVSLAALIAVFASPLSVSSFPMAQHLGGNDALAGGQVVFSTALSSVTVFLWVFALRALGLLA